jgi:putative flippase GtrA
LPSLIYRALSFGAVGVLSSAGYVVTLSLGVEKLGFSVLVSALLAFGVGTLISYVGNTLVTFRMTLAGSTAWRFLAVVGIGMVLNQAIAFGLDRLGAHYLVIAAAVFVVIPAFNFVAHSAFTYRTERT